MCPMLSILFVAYCSSAMSLDWNMDNFIGSYHQTEWEAGM